MAEHVTSDDLSAYAACNLPEEACLSVEAHLLNCDACGQALDQLTGNSTLENRLASLREKDLVPEATPAWISELKERRLLEDEILRRKQLGQYEILSILGKGGMGAVYVTWHVHLQRQVALKTMSYRLTGETKAVERFRREAQLLAQLDHPHVVRAYDGGVADNVPYLAMEFVAGSDLRKWVTKRGPLPIDQACTFIAQAAQAIDHAQSHGIVHRDIKPANLLMTEDETAVKLSDLGLAKLEQIGMSETTISELTQRSATMGTPDYMAPEQWVSSDVDVRADIYSLGCTFYFLLTGQVPYPGGSAESKRARHNAGNPTPIQRLRPDVAPSVEAVIRKMMAVEPANRYQLPGEVSAALANGKTAAQPFRPNQKFGLIAAGIAGVFLIAAVFGLFLLDPFGSQSFKKIAAKPHPKENKKEKNTAKPEKKGNKKQVQPGMGNPKSLVRIGIKGKPVLLKTLRGHAGGVTSIAYAPNGETFATGSGDTTAKIWNAANLEQCHVLRHDEVVAALAYSPDSKKLVTCDGKGAVNLWNIAQEKSVPIGKHEKRFLAIGLSVAYSPDGKHIASGCARSEAQKIWDPLGKRQPVDLRHGEIEEFFKVAAVAFSPDSRLLATGLDRSQKVGVRLWDVTRQSKLDFLPTGHDTKALAFSQTGVLLASSRRGGVRLAKINLQNLSATLDDKHMENTGDATATSIAFIPNSQLVAAAFPKGKIAKWNHVTGKKVAQFGAHGVGASCHLAVSPDGQRLVTGAGEGEVKVWALDYSTVKITDLK